jgi:hypothetical protein
MKCLPVRNVIAGLLLAGIAGSLQAAPVIARTQVGLYDLATSQHEVYNLTTAPAERGARLTLTRPGDNAFALQMQLIPCLAPGGEQSGESFLRLQNAHVTGTDAALYPLLGFISDNDLQSISVPLENDRQLMFNQDSAAMMIADGTLLQPDGQPCPTR